MSAPTTAPPFVQQPDEPVLGQGALRRHLLRQARELGQMDRRALLHAHVHTCCGAASVWGDVKFLPICPLTRVFALLLPPVTPSQEGDGKVLSPAQSAASGFVAACIGPTLNNPFDVVKTRM